tara:strand:+ start:404 stop:703 length:300 start_codon:yes stop_codon:yes gene_type:complete
MHKFRNFLNELKKEDVERLERALHSGMLSQMLEKKLNELNSNLRICPVCSSDVGNEAYVMIFGPNDLRKKAAFCAQDCLEYFLTYLKQQNKSKIKEIDE